jgi:hypothetical protein
MSPFAVPTSTTGTPEHIVGRGLMGRSFTPGAGTEYLYFLAGNFTGSANRTLSLFCDGANWLETARSTN